jgi:hypothetical protein
MELKYVRHARIGFVLWPRTDDLWHSHIAATLPRGGIESAGFASVAGGKVRCWGLSESLQIGSAPDDGKALAEQLGLAPTERKD